MTPQIVKISRRTVLKGMGATTAAGLTLAVLPMGCTAPPPEGSTNGWRAWIHIDSDGSLTLFSPRMEMGQGILSAVGMIVAEELDVDWSAMRVVHAPLDDRYGSLVTENSDSIRSNWDQLRQLAATARIQLLRAAGERWQVEPSSCSTAHGHVIHDATARRASYAELADAASRLDLPASVPMRSATGYRLISRGAPRLDIPGMVNGSLQFASDVSMPGLLTATVTHSPAIGGKVASINDREARASTGVKAIVDLGNAVAVVADHFWHARQGLQKLEVTWAAPDQPALDDSVMRKLLAESCAKPAVVIMNSGDADARLAASKRSITREYALSYHPHATMEPMTCVADVRNGSCEVWVPTQDPWGAHREALAHGLSPTARAWERLALKFLRRASRVKIHAMPMGGAFGRRLHQDFVREAVLISKTVKAPVKLLWTREEDMTNDFYRPASHHRIEASLNEHGQLDAWRYRIAGSGILDHGIELPYDCPNVRVEISPQPIGVPTGSLRSTAHTPNAFARECTMDELALMAGRDPLEFRLASLSKLPRMRRVLEIAAQRADWSRPIESGRGRGVAIHPSKESFVAQIAEVAIDKESIRVERVVCVVDCGIAVNPGGIRAQLEGAIIMGLTACLKNPITVRNGQIEQKNFDTFPLLRMHEAPIIDVHVVDSQERPGGIGEPGMPPIAPAVANAVFMASGKRPNSLPFGALASFVA